MYKEEDYLDTQEAARLLKRSESSLLRWRRDGYPRLPFYKTGGRVQYLKIEVEAFRKNNRHFHLASARAKAEQDKKEAVRENA